MFYTVVKQVARNDSNKRLLVQQGAVPLLVMIAEQGETEEQYGKNISFYYI